MSDLELTEEQKQILAALNTFTNPAGCKEIGEAAGMPWRSVMGKLRALREEKLVISPVKSKYIITEKGRETIA
jgi:predicted transcriptional regulator